MPSLPQTETTINRGLREAIPRDWFFPLLPSSVADMAFVIRRFLDNKRIPIFTTKRGREVMPAVILALLASKTGPLLAYVRALAAATRLSTASGADLDSWAFQFYGDFALREAGMGDLEFRTLMGRLLYRIGVDGTTPIHFQPVATREGILTFLDTFSYHTVIPRQTSFGTLQSGMVLRGRGGSLDHFGPPYFAFNLLNVHQMINGAGLIVVIIGKGMNMEGLTLSQRDKEFARALVRKAKPMGIAVTVVFGSSTGGGGGV